MKNDSAILHISDLHLVNFTPVNDSIKLSYLAENDDFLDLFIDSVTDECKKLKSKLSYILITGDLANEGTKQEYEKASIFINKLCEKLQVPKDNICIVPGNHDINWTDIKKL